MAVIQPHRYENCRIARFCLTTANIAEAAHFYECAFGFRRLSTERYSGADFERLMEVDGGADSVTLGLGAERLELVEFDIPGNPYPAGTLACDQIFQHFAIVVTDMERAYGRLDLIGGWSAISVAGPQLLPEASGGVTAFKFRDPEGHPLELLRFPAHGVPARWRSAPGQEECLGIDHTALSVADSGQSIASYQRLGFRPAAQTRNRGSGQQRLDGVPDPDLQVTAMSTGEDGAHLELLCYASPRLHAPFEVRSNDIAATRMVVEFDRHACSGLGKSVVRQAMQDPDGHRLLIVSPAGER